ncbi:MAG: hypothetical protein LC793_16855 [Thermomicrobia bacterium]|nr:hypothetical protein [Thermomicrobia bacterium]MCA1724607.1 hypothetical protein [Thermomicrobia bacterium]
MAEIQHAGEWSQEADSATRRIKRRGLVAGAAALVAGIAALRTTGSVAAGIDGDVILGMPNMTANDTTITNTVTTSGHALVLHCDNASYGFGLQATGTGYGVQGTGGTYAGVFGDTSNSSGAGVSGLARSSSGGTGVSGNCDAATGIGVHGTSDKGTGVLGETTGTGIYGVYGKSAAAGGVGVSGNCTGGYGVLGSVSDGYGVLGQAVTGNGLYGFSQQNHAVVGQTARPYFGGVLGIATIANTVGIYGSTKNSGGVNVASAYAGYFDGNLVAVNGVKSAAVPHHDGSYRLVYCMESPENWFEDFGKGKLVNGTAAITLDPDFAAIVQTDDYHVFLTPRGDCKGLSIDAQTATGFSVREVQGGTSTLAFSYRIVARRKDIQVERLARVALPTITTDTAAVSPSVPKPPAVPKPQQPPT